MPPTIPVAPAPRLQMRSDGLAVRDRLAAAGPMDAESAKAVDKLWLDLLHTGAKR